MQSLRKTFANDSYLEVETPMLQSMHGGASARPFKTHMNAFDMELFLRIAPELFLKRAVVGGIERVFEINRNFRNEGADSTHSPEFAMLEAYQAYGDYITMAELTQKLIQNAAQDVFGTQVLSLDDGEDNDLSGEWARLSMFESLSDAVGQEVIPSTPMSELKKIADKVDIEIDHPQHGKYVEELWEHFVKPNLTKPTFVMDFPVDTSPLTRDHREKPGVVEKWDLYIRGYEQATGYSELVDPVIQRERFVAQMALAQSGDPEAMKLDEEFLKALEFGMPPSGGMGMGIDRLLMSLTGLGIRETILFPLVK
jgi:lysyl-tRNA synthetase class 2